MKDPYTGAMPDSFFRVLTPEEEKQFRQSARDTWTPTLPLAFSMFHPVVRDEWRKIDMEKSNQYQPQDDITRLTNLLETVADSVSRMTDEEVRAELAEEGPTVVNIHEVLHKTLRNWLENRRNTLKTEKE